MPVVFVPTMLRGYTGGQETVTVEGSTLAAVIEQLDSKHPGIRERMISEGKLADWLSVVVDGELAPRGLYTEVPSTGEVHFLPAISGG